MKQSIQNLLIQPDFRDFFQQKAFTKSEYARKKGVSPTWVNALIEQGKLKEIRIAGGSFVMEPEA